MGYRSRSPSGRSTDIDSLSISMSVMNSSTIGTSIFLSSGEITMNSALSVDTSISSILPMRFPFLSFMENPASWSAVRPSWFSQYASSSNPLRVAVMQYRSLPGRVQLPHRCQFHQWSAAARQCPRRLDDTTLNGTKIPSISIIRNPNSDASARHSIDADISLHVRAA